jgi:hypothetical protein
MSLLWLPLPLLLIAGDIPSLCCSPAGDVSAAGTSDEESDVKNEITREIGELISRMTKQQEVLADLHCEVRCSLCAVCRGAERHVGPAPSTLLSLPLPPCSRASLHADRRCAYLWFGWCMSTEPAAEGRRYAVLVAVVVVRRRVLNAPLLRVVQWRSSAPLRRDSWSNRLLWRR